MIPVGEMKMPQMASCCSRAISSHAASRNRCNPNDASAALFSKKSSTGRTGLEHLYAGWIDPGFVGQLTLEFTNVRRGLSCCNRGKRYMQMVVYDLTAPAARDHRRRGRLSGATGRNAGTGGAVMAGSGRNMAT